MITNSTMARKVVLVFCVFCLTALAAVMIRNGAAAAPAAVDVPAPEAPTATFNANAGTLGAIPDGGSCGVDGSPRNVTFSVSGLSGAPTSVSLTMTVSHSWVGDVTATLIAPNATQHVLFGYTGSTTAGGCGDSSNLTGPYTFADSASNSWWQAATAVGDTVSVASGSYRTSARGGAGAVNPQPPTNLSAAFSGVANPNGTWTLRLTDGGGGDTGSISAASLTITSGVSPPQHVLDFNGDAKTDYTVVRNIGGGASGQVAWFTRYAGLAAGQTDVFGIASDFFVSGDFDGDSKSDVAVWRPNAQAAFFYILRSSTNTFVPVQWGITGDDPTVVGDYDGDGKTDCAVYRGGASAGQQSFWHVLRSSDGGYLPIQWGQNGDFPAPGDYDGDGRADAAVQRNAGGGSAIFFRRYFNGSFDQIVFGTPTDVVVPGDYDGDGKTDLATIRGSGGQINWFYDPSSIAGTQIVQTIFGASATDFPTQGDYDGDGRTDQAVWRPSATPGQSAFFVNGSTAGFFAFQHGQNGDYPVANFNSH